MVFDHIFRAARKVNSVGLMDGENPINAPIPPAPGHDNFEETATTSTHLAIPPSRPTMFMNEEGGLLRSTAPPFSPLAEPAASCTPAESPSPSEPSHVGFGPLNPGVTKGKGKEPVALYSRADKGKEKEHR